MTTPIGEGFKSINVTLRKQFDLYANVRPIKNLPASRPSTPMWTWLSSGKIRKGSTSGSSRRLYPGVCTSLKVITEKGSTRIARFAFEYAAKHGRKKVHAIHKANIMKLTDGLFLRCSKKIAEEHPEIQYAEHIVDKHLHAARHQSLQQYDVMVMENLYGDILSDLCSGFVGRLGLVPGATWASMRPSLRQYMALRPISPARVKQTRLLCCSLPC